MKFVDSIKLTVSAGKGGDGAVAFRRELYIPKGGPAGGDGGKGGDVIFVASTNINTLLELKFQKLIKAKDGDNGQQKNMHGHSAKDRYIKVPVGTLVINEKTNSIICDFKINHQEFIIAKGGSGGRGNSRFANSRNKAPTIFECGNLGEELEITLELKLLADIGFVGLPNAGKSTLLSVLTKAKPQIADYEFTTINPQLGVSIDKNNRSFVIADLPGLIKGASLGKGLGLLFLKHIERCRVIVHIIDASNNYGKDDVNDIYKRYQIIVNELKAYNPKLLKREQLIVLNKIDVEGSSQSILLLKDKIKNIKIIEVSALQQKNLEQLKIEIANLLENNDATPLWTTEDKNKILKDNHKLYKFNDFQSVDSFKITNLGNGRWNVTGDGVFKIYHKFPPTTSDNLLVFNNQLKKLGIFEELRNKKALSGDTIIIFDIEMEWKD